MKNYVLGFLFSPDLESVALILKNRPAFLEGKLNGIGGHVEEDESPMSAVIREFEEETGLATAREDWTLVDVGNFKDGARIATFGGVGGRKCPTRSSGPDSLVP